MAFGDGCYYYGSHIIWLKFLFIVVRRSGILGQVDWYKCLVFDSLVVFVIR